MEDKTKIDELFKQGLGGFSAEPPVDTWQNIQDNLIAARHKKRIALWRITGTAAALILAFFSGYYFDTTTRSLNPESEGLDPVVQFSPQGTSGQWSNDDLNRDMVNPVSDSEETPPLQSVEALGKANESMNLVQAISLPEKRAATTESVQPEGNDLLKTNSEHRKTHASVKPNVEEANAETEGFAHIPEGKKETITADDKIEKPTVIDLEAPASTIAQAGNKVISPSYAKSDSSFTADDGPFVYADTEKEKKKKRYNTRSAFELGAVASPTFAFNDVSGQTAQQSGGNGSYLTNPSREQEDALQNSYAAGLNLSYRTGLRWEVSTGLHLNHWNQVSSDVFLTADPYGPITTTGITARGITSTGLVTYTSGNTVFDATKVENVGPNEYFLIPDIEQRYQFLEVPVRVGYYLFESQRWSFKLQAGVSGRFLANSDVQLVFEDGSTENYDGLELKNFSLQLIGGTGLGYKATKNLSINLTPSIQYGLTPVNKNAETETYFHQFLVYTGLTYGF